MPGQIRADVLRASELGHRLHLEVREFPEYDAPPKYYVTCSCGWVAPRVTRSRKAASESGSRHLRGAVDARVS